MAETKMIRIEYYRSKNSTPFKHKAVVKGLGFTRLNQIVERVDNESIRGMVKAIPHLVRILEDSFSVSGYRFPVLSPRPRQVLTGS
jgi:large subunit ribosomal protein L30